MSTSSGPTATPGRTSQETVPPPATETQSQAERPVPTQVTLSQTQALIWRKLANLMPPLEKAYERKANEFNETHDNADRKTKLEKRLKAVRCALDSFRWGLHNWAAIIGNPVNASGVAKNELFWGNLCKDLQINSEDEKAFRIEDDPTRFLLRPKVHEPFLRRMYYVAKTLADMLDKAAEGSLAPMDDIFRPRAGDSPDNAALSHLAGPQLATKRDLYLNSEQNLLLVDVEECSDEELVDLNKDLEDTRMRLARADLRRVQNELQETRMMTNCDGLKLALANMTRFAEILIRAAEELDRPEEERSREEN